MLNHPIRSYLLITLQHFISLVFSYVAIIFPNWLTFRAPEPLGFRTNYGLFLYCSIVSNQCRTFPDSDKGDCLDGYCNYWFTARYSMLFAVILGTLLFFFLLFLLFSDTLKQTRGWPIVLGGIGAYTFSLITAMTSIAWLFNHSNEYYVGTNYDFSFYLNIAGWLLGLISGIVILFCFPFNNQGYEEIQ